MQRRKENQFSILKRFPAANLVRECEPGSSVSRISGIAARLKLLGPLRKTMIPHNAEQEGGIVAKC